MDGSTLGQLANDAGFENLDVMAAMKLFRFGQLVAEAEREACAKVCEEKAARALACQIGNAHDLPNVMLRHHAAEAQDCAADIRARYNV